MWTDINFKRLYGIIIIPTLYSHQHSKPGYNIPVSASDCVVMILLDDFDPFRDF